VSALPATHLFTFYGGSCVNVLPGCQSWVGVIITLAPGEFQSDDDPGSQMVTWYLAILVLRSCLFLRIVVVLFSQSGCTCPALASLTHMSPRLKRCSCGADTGRAWDRLAACTFWEPGKYQSAKRRIGPGGLAPHDLVTLSLTETAQVRESILKVDHQHTKSFLPGTFSLRPLLRKMFCPCVHLSVVRFSECVQCNTLSKCPTMFLPDPTVSLE
jgi:hypothetical protein